MQRCDVLARYSEVAGELTRTYLSGPMHGVHRELAGWLEPTPTHTRVDTAGNFFGRYPADTPDAPVLLVGSHLDTVRNAGRYDGTLGVLIGVAVIEALAAQNRRLPFAVEVVGFSEEEGVRYGTPFLGSRALTGRFDLALLDRADDKGVAVARAMREFGQNPDEILDAAYRRSDVLGYLEVHIEQGPQLAAANQPVGVASAIAGQSRAGITFRGEAGHAGTVPVRSRKDALVGAATFVVACETLALEFDELFATVGWLEPSPGAINVIPGEATLTLDLRHAEDAVRDGAWRTLQRRAQTIADARGLEMRWRDLGHQPATPLHPQLTDWLTPSPDTPVLVSGAGHDAMVMAPFTPSALLFVRSPNGISHNPAEMVLEEDVADALGTVMQFIDRLAAEDGREKTETVDGSGARHA